VGFVDEDVGHIEGVEGGVECGDDGGGALDHFDDAQVAGFEELLLVAQDTGGVEHDFDAAVGASFEVFFYESGGIPDFIGWVGLEGETEDQIGLLSRGMWRVGRVGVGGAGVGVASGQARDGAQSSGE